MSETIIHRKKGKALIIVLISLPGLLLFFLTSIYGLFSDKDVFEKGLLFIFLAIFSFGLWSIIRIMNDKILSDNPEFKISDKKILVYDNPYYQEIPLEDIIDCKIYYGPRGATLLGIRIRKESKLVSNSNSFQLAFFNISEKSGKMIFISMAHADTDPDYFTQLIYSKVIEQRNKMKTKESLSTTTE